MNLREFQTVKDLKYREYCDYLQKKYGIGRADYMTPAHNPIAKCKRTGEGLFAHHKYEDTAIMLSTKAEAEQHPFEWQKAENIIYCDFLEHLLLHVKIVECPAQDRVAGCIVGYGGAVNFIIPELNDLYSGWEPKQPWKIRCWDLVKDDLPVYMEILKLLVRTGHIESPKTLFTSFNHQFGLWDGHNNIPLFCKILEMFEQIKKEDGDVDPTDTHSP